MKKIDVTDLENRVITFCLGEIKENANMGIYINNNYTHINKSKLLKKLKVYKRFLAYSLTNDGFLVQAVNNSISKIDSL